MRRTAVAALLTPLVVSLAALPPLPTPSAEAASPADAAGARGSTDRKIRLNRWADGERWRTGTLDGVRVREGRIVLADPQGQREYDGRTYDAVAWDSAWVEPGFSYTELIASWSARTPGDSLVEISVRGRTAAGRRTSWDVLGRWASGDRHVERRTVSGQDDDGTRVNVDTWVAPDGLASYRLRLTLLRRAGTTAKPSVGLATVMTSRVPGSAGATSDPGPGGGTVLPVPRYSQMVHRGHYDQWGGGGEAWCSPTSTSMVLGHYDALPPAKRYGWVPDGHVDPWVDYAARMVFDHAYDGAGNWPFNTAYAAPLVGEAFVTRLRSLREAGQLVAAGIPVVVSIAFSSGELDGAPISSSNGHLLVVVGFRDNGDVVVNDPAASNRRGIRRVYDRAQLEKVWLDASGGLSYVIHDEDHPLPEGHTNW